MVMMMVMTMMVLMLMLKPTCHMRLLIDASTLHQKEFGFTLARFDQSHKTEEEQSIKNDLVDDTANQVGLYVGP